MTTTEAPTFALARPQPVGVFPLPAGYFLLDSSAELSAVRECLSKGKLPDQFPTAARFYELALDGDLEGCVEELSKLDPTDLIVRTNQFLLDPTQEELDQLLRLSVELDDLTLTAHLRMLGFVLGLLPDAPAPGTADGEFAANAHAAMATLALERGAPADAIEHLEAGAQAAASAGTALVGQLLGQMANAQLDEGGTQRASVTFPAAIDALADTDLF